MMGIDPIYFLALHGAGIVILSVIAVCVHAAQQVRL